MMRWGWVLILGVSAACGGDEDGEVVPCTVTFGGDVSGTDSCRMFLCYPRNSDYQSMDFATSIDSQLMYAAIPEVSSTMPFAAGQTLTLDQLRDSTQLSVKSGDKTYVARQTPQGGGARNAAESATLTLTSVTPPTGGDNVCNGYVTGTMTVSLVEISGAGTSNEVVGAGRATMTVTAGP